MCDAAGTATCVRRVRMAYFLTAPVRAGRPAGRGAHPPPADGGTNGAGSVVGGGGGGPTDDVWACARMPVEVMEPAWACGSDLPLTCALRSTADGVAAGDGAISGSISFTTSPNCAVRVDGSVGGLRPGAAYTLTMTRSGHLSAGSGGGGGHPTADAAHPADAYDPLGEGRLVGWTLVAGGGGVAALSTVEGGLAVGEAAGRGLRLDLVGGGGSPSGIAACVVGYAEQAR